jgi:hypothetical protein
VRHGLQGAGDAMLRGLRVPVLPAGAQQAAKYACTGEHRPLLAHGGGAETLGVRLPRLLSLSVTATLQTPAP